MRSARPAQDGNYTQEAQSSVTVSEPVAEEAPASESPPEYAEEDWAPGMTDGPVPMCLDVDPFDLSFDRLPARLGMIDDGAPLFIDTTAVPGAGALVSVSLLVHSRIFGVAHRLYGGIGPAFLRTTLLESARF